MFAFLNVSCRRSGHGCELLIAHCCMSVCLDVNVIVIAMLCDNSCSRALVCADVISIVQSFVIILFTDWSHVMTGSW